MRENFHLDLFAESTGLARDGLMLATEWWAEFDYEPADPSVGMRETIYLNELGCDGLAGDAKVAFLAWLAGHEAQIEELIWERIAEEREKSADMREDYEEEQYRHRVLSAVFKRNVTKT